MKRILLVLLFITACAPQHQYIYGVYGEDSYHGNSQGYGIVTGLSWENGRLRYGPEVDYNHQEGSGGDKLDTTSIRGVVTYDVFQGERVRVFTGAGAGLGYSYTKGYQLLMSDDQDSNGMTGVFDGRVGIEYLINQDVKLSLIARQNHISRVWSDDEGSNPTEIMGGVSGEFSWSKFFKSLMFWR